MGQVLDNYISQIKAIEKGLEKQAEIIVKKNEEKILDYNRKDQLFNKGIDSKGKKLSPYAESTKKLKRKTGLPTNRKTHFQTGKHYKNFYTNVRNKSLEIMSSTKTEKGFDLGKHLNQSEGGDVYGLTKKNNDTVNDNIILPKLIQWAFKQMKI